MLMNPLNGIFGFQLMPLVPKNKKQHKQQREQKQAERKIRTFIQRALLIDSTRHGERISRLQNAKNAKLSIVIVLT